MSTLLTMALDETNHDALREILSEYQSVYDLMDSTIEEIEQINGVGRPNAHRIKAVIELARRLANPERTARNIVRSAADVVRLLTPEMWLLDREVVKVVMLDVKNHVIKISTAAIGTLSSCPVHPREIFREAIKRNAASIVIAHNHPSTVPEPSTDDIAVTKRICEAGEIIGIRVLDHLIIGRPDFVSLRERGHASFR